MLFQPCLQTIEPANLQRFCQGKILPSKKTRILHLLHWLTHPAVWPVWVWLREFASREIALYWCCDVTLANLIIKPFFHVRTKPTLSTCCTAVARSAYELAPGKQRVASFDYEIYCTSILFIRIKGALYLKRPLSTRKSKSKGRLCEWICRMPLAEMLTCWDNWLVTTAWKW